MTTDSLVDYESRQDIKSEFRLMRNEMSKTDPIQIRHGERDITVHFLVNKETRGVDSKSHTQYWSSPHFSEIERSLGQMGRCTISESDQQWSTHQWSASSAIPKGRFKFMRTSHCAEDAKTGEVHFHYDRFFDSKGSEQFTEITVTL